MATHAHCAYAFECLAANFERRPALSLARVEELWEQYHAGKPRGDDSEQDDEEGDSVEEEEGDDNDDGVEMTEPESQEPISARPAAISRLVNRDGASSSSAMSSNSSLPSTRSLASSTPNSKSGGSSGAGTPASSRSSLFSFTRRRKETREEYPLFVTWNTVSRGGYKSLRGCIGTFEAQELEYGLRAYALTSAFEDARFPPIPQSLLPSLQVQVTLLTNFSQPSRDAMDWTLGKHGLRISFLQHGRRYGATYLPDVAEEQGWTKEETLISLMRKAGWNGSSSSWMKTWRDGKGELVTYEGKQVGLKYPEWREWRDWVEKVGTSNAEIR